MDRISGRIMGLWLVSLLGLAVAGQALADDSSRFIKKAAASNIAEVELAELAMERAQSKQVKKLAQHIKQDHARANAALKSVADQKGVPLPDETDADHKQEKRRLAKLEGSEFDRAYIEAMVKEHRQDIKQFEKQTRGGDDQLKQFAEQTLPKLRQHLTHAREIQKKLQAKK